MFVFQEQIRSEHAKYKTMEKKEFMKQLKCHFYAPALSRDIFSILSISRSAFSIDEGKKTNRVPLKNLFHPIALCQNSVGSTCMNKMTKADDYQVQGIS